MTIQPNSIEEICAALRENNHRILPRGGGTKPALSTTVGAASSPVSNASANGPEILEMGAISGLLEYEPGEFTFTALAGTRLADIQAILAQHGQYLPFDPLLVRRGATLGGTVAANAAGPGRYHYGGIRDFLIGVRFVNGEGVVVHGGGKVVKNAAGFDLPKLMVGSLGRLGIMVELSFKVFPRPETFTTLQVTCAGLEEALAVMRRLSDSRLDLDSLELAPALNAASASVSTASAYELWARLGGLEQALPARLERLRSLLRDCAQCDIPLVLSGEDDQRFWQAASELEWAPEDWSLVKVPLTPGRIPALEAALAAAATLGLVQRRYSAGGQVAWLALEPSPASQTSGLADILTAQGLNGLVYFAPTGGLPGQSHLGEPFVGEPSGRSLYQRVKSVLDPAQRFVEI